MATVVCTVPSFFFAFHFSDHGGGPWVDVPCAQIATSSSSEMDPTSLGGSDTLTGHRGVDEPMKVRGNPDDTPAWSDIETGDAEPKKVPILGVVSVKVPDFQTHSTDVGPTSLEGSDTLTGHGGVNEGNHDYTQDALNKLSFAQIELQHMIPALGPESQDTLRTADSKMKDVIAELKVSHQRRWVIKRVGLQDALKNLAVAYRACVETEAKGNRHLVNHVRDAIVYVAVSISGHSKPDLMDTIHSVFEVDRDLKSNILLSYHKIMTDESHKFQSKAGRKFHKFRRQKKTTTSHKFAWSRLPGILLNLSQRSS